MGSERSFPIDPFVHVFYMIPGITRPAASLDCRGSIHSPPSSSSVAGFLFSAFMAHSLAFADTFSRLAGSPFSSSHLAHLWNQTLARLGFSPFTLVPRSKSSRIAMPSGAPSSPLAFSAAYNDASRSTSWLQRSYFLGHVSNKPAKSVRPHSGLPKNDRNSNNASLDSSAGWLEKTRDNNARLRRARPLSGEAMLLY